MVKSYCIDCGEENDPRAKRCRDCYHKTPEWRAKQVEAHADPSVRQRIGEAVAAAHKRGCYDGRDTEEYRQKISRGVSEAHKRGAYDGRDTEEWRRNISAAQKARFVGPEGEERRREASERMAGFLASPEGEEWRQNMAKTRKEQCASLVWRQERSESVRAAWERGVYDDRATKEVRQKMSEGLEAAWKRGCYDGVYQSPTLPEIALAEALDKFGLKHQSQFRPDGYSKPYDEFVHPSILIEVQGSYWHSSKEQQGNDLEKARWAHQNGYKFIAIWDFHLEQYGAESLVEWWVLPLSPTTRVEALPRMIPMF